jgi:hypothetical protein
MRLENFSVISLLLAVFAPFTSACRTADNTESSSEVSASGPSGSSERSEEMIQLEQGDYVVSMKRPENCNPDQVTLRQSWEYPNSNSSREPVIRLTFGDRILRNEVRPAVCREGNIQGSVVLRLNSPAKLALEGGLSALDKVEKIDLKNAETGSNLGTKYTLKSGSGRTVLVFEAKASCMSATFTAGRLTKIATKPGAPETTFIYQDEIVMDNLIRPMACLDGNPLLLATELFESLDTDTKIEAHKSLNPLQGFRIAAVLKISGARDVTASLPRTGGTKEPNSAHTRLSALLTELGAPSVRQGGSSAREISFSCFADLMPRRNAEPKPCTVAIVESSGMISAKETNLEQTKQLRKDVREIGYPLKRGNNFFLVNCISGPTVTGGADCAVSEVNPEPVEPNAVSGIRPFKIAEQTDEDSLPARLFADLAERAKFESTARFAVPGMTAQIEMTEPSERAMAGTRIAAIKDEAEKTIFSCSQAFDAVALRYSCEASRSKIYGRAAKSLYNVLSGGATFGSQKQRSETQFAKAKLVCHAPKTQPQLMSTDGYRCVLTRL